MTHTPHQQHKLNKIRPKICPLCLADDANEDHILHTCEAPELIEVRKRFDDKMCKLLSPTASKPSYTQSHPHSTHPLINIPMQQIYPLANQLFDTPVICILRALPESRWYRQSNTKTNMIVVQNPNLTAQVPQYPQHQNQVHIPTQLFWTLIAWHDLTHETTPVPIHTYDNRAHDIWEAVTKSKETSGSSALCWATDRILLDIVIDECKCTTELFSNIVNTYHRFLNRRMLYAHPNFSKHGNLHLDGLHQTAYVGSVFGNPPFDGNIANKSTINQTLDNAANAALTTIGFRAVFLLPLTPDKLTIRLTHPRATLLMRCPNDSIPFMPYSKWYGNDTRTGCYKESNTHLMLLMYQSENTGSLSNINIHSLNQKLANWYMHVAPKNKQTHKDFLYTTIPLHFFTSIEENNIPENWNFWAIPSSPPCIDLYSGAPQDNTYMQKTPFRDITYWPRCLSKLGLLPDTFPEFLRDIGFTVKRATELKNLIPSLLKTHTLHVFSLYWKRLSELRAIEKRKNKKVPIANAITDACI